MAPVKSMLHIVLSILSLLLASAILLFGVGLQGTLIALRAEVEGFSVDTTGIVMAAYFIGYAAGTRICPYLVRQFGHIRTYAILATIASAVVVAYPLVPSPLPWFLLRAITGICIVGLFIVIESWLNEIAPSQSRGRFFAVYMLITLLALAFGQYLILAADVADFDLFAMTTILLSLALVPVAMTRIRQPEVIQSTPLHLGTLYRNSPMGVLGTLVAGVINGAFWGMAPVFASRIGLTEINIVIFISFIVFGGATLQWPVGLLSDRFDRRKVLTLTAFLGGLVAIGMNMTVILNLDEIVLHAGSFLYGGFAFSLYALSVSHANDRLESGQTLDAARSLLQLYGIGAALGPLLAGYTMSLFGAASLPLFFSFWMLVFGLFSLYRMHVSEAPAAEEQGAYIPMHQTTPVALEMDPRLEEAGEEKTEAETVSEVQREERRAAQSTGKES